MIPSFPKIFNIGTRHVSNIFFDEVEVTEKVDGSQFCFGKIDGKLHLRSKGAELYIENPEKMFHKGIVYVERIKDKLPDNIIFYCEYLRSPKHNSLQYDRIPKNNLILFGVMGVDQTFHLDLDKYAELLGIERVPVLFSGKIDNINKITGLLDYKSVLGNTKIEGIVVKNYEKSFFLADRLIPLMSAKYVSDSFKEVHRERWGKEETTKGKMETFFESFRTEARWGKAVQHLKEKGELNNDPKDIGNLIKEIYVDIETEEKENIKDWLWIEFKNQVKRRSTAGMPEWYKKKLMENSFKENLIYE